MLFVTYDPIEYWVLIPKAVEILLFVVLAVKIRRLKDYLVNKLFFAGFLIWAAYVGINSIIYLMAANSETAFLIANILHKIALSCAIIFALLLFISTLVIKDGHPALKEKPFYISVVGSAVVCAVAIVTQVLLIVDQNGTPLVSETEWASAELIRVAMPIVPLSAFLVAFPLLICILAFYFLAKLIKKVADNAVKKQMRLLLSGIALIPLGMVYFIFIQYTVVNIVTATLGHAIWTISPVLIWQSRK